MEIKPKTKLLFLALLFCIISVIVFGEIVISFHTGHECVHIEAQCFDCLKITVLRNFLKIIKIASIGFYLAILLLFFNNYKIKYFKSNIFQLSPIVLKVRFNT